MGNGRSYLGLASRAEELNVGENSQAELDASAKAGFTTSDRAVSGSTTPGQCGPGSDGNEGVLCIPQSPSITGTSPSDCLVSYPGHLLEVGVLLLSRGAVGVFYSPSRLDNQARSVTDSNNLLFALFSVKLLFRLNDILIPLLSCRSIIFLFFSFYAYVSVTKLYLGWDGWK